jgi:hypothetical protein
MPCAWLSALVTLKKVSVWVCATLFNDRASRVERMSVVRFMVVLVVQLPLML